VSDSASSDQATPEAVASVAIDLGQGRRFDALGSPVERLVHPLTVGSDQVGVSVVTLAPGGKVRRHRHSFEEAYFVVSGLGRMFVDGVGEFDLHRGRCVYISSNRVHGQINTSPHEDLVIVCSLSPPPVEGELPEFFEDLA
jgi:quercetin dioxygenase-like cupin family protein